MLKIMSKIYTLLFFLILLVGTSCNSSKSELEDLNRSISAAKKSFAPDSRVAVFDVKAESKNGKIILSGETNLPEAKSELLKNIAEVDADVIDQIEVLPSPKFKDKNFAVVRLSVCNIRSKPKHSSELSTQAILGTPVLVYKSKGDWLYIQTPDGYLGWVDSAGVALLDKAQKTSWQNSDKIIFTDVFGMVYDKPNLRDAEVVSDVVAGSILKLLEQKNDFFKVQFPDGRVGYIPSNSAQKTDDFLGQSSIYKVENVIDNAKKMLGIPYLWGGTSVKGMDCSGFTKTIYFLNGMLLPRDASQQVNVGKKIELDKRLTKVEKGDLLFFGKLRDDGSQRITHVALYLGNGEIIHATGEVKIESLYEESPIFAKERLETLLQARRIVGQEGKNGVKALKNVKSYWQ